MDKQIHEKIEHILSFTQEGNAYVDAYALKRAKALITLLEQLPEAAGERGTYKQLLETNAAFLSRHVIIATHTPKSSRKKGKKSAIKNAVKKGNKRLRPPKELPPYIRNINGIDMNPSEYEQHLEKNFRKTYGRKR